MNKEQKHLLEAVDRVDRYLDENPQIMGPVVTAPARQNLSASHERLDGLMKKQLTWIDSARSTTETKRKLRQALVEDHMQPIGVVARARLRHVRELVGFTIPAAKASYGTLVAAGYGMAESARLYEATFLEAGLPADFIEKLLGATDALRDAANTKGQARALRIEATAALVEEARSARDALRVLDALVRKSIKDRSVLARWKAVSRVGPVPTSPSARSGAANGGTGSSGGAGTGGSVGPLTEVTTAAA